MPSCLQEVLSDFHPNNDFWVDSSVQGIMIDFMTEPGTMDIGDPHLYRRGCFVEAANADVWTPKHLTLKRILEGAWNIIIIPHTQNHDE